MVVTSDNSNNSTTIVQITDSHLFATTDECLLGVPTYYSLQAVVDQVLREHTDIELVLGTGDISQDGSPTSYQYFAEQADRIDAPMRWMAGNHDVSSVQSESSAAQKWLQPVCDLGAWRIIMLDSSVDGSVFGHLSAAQLELLEQALSSAGERHVLVALHHQPVPIQSAWLDKIGVRNADDFLAVTDRFTNIRGIIWGHVHQEFEQLRKGVRMLAAPSTCVQFKPQSQDFALDNTAPGYRWFKLSDDGSFTTGVSRIACGQFQPDMDVSGY